MSVPEIMAANAKLVADLAAAISAAAKAGLPADAIDAALVAAQTLVSQADDE
jgi:transcriptional/translational regulatory protein YebC/TACO1